MEAGELGELEEKARAALVGVDATRNYAQIQVINGIYQATIKKRKIPLSSVDLAMKYPMGEIDDAGLEAEKRRKAQLQKPVEPKPAKTPKTEKVEEPEVPTNEVPDEPSDAPINIPPEVPDEVKQADVPTETQEVPDEPTDEPVLPESSWSD